MSFPTTTQTFYRLPDVSVSTATIVGVLDALYSSLTQIVDFQSVSLPASHLWSWTRYRQGGTTTEAVYSTSVPVACTATPQIIFGGRVTIGTPSMLTDTATASNLHCGLNLRGGAFNAWDVALPFTSGAFSGFYRCAAIGANAIGTIIRVYVSQESFFVNVIQSATSMYWIIIGACVEPLTSDTSSDAETDNRVYGMFVSGGAGICNFAVHSTNSSQSPTNHSITNGSGHGTCFQPSTGVSGAGGQNAAAAAMVMGSSLTTTQYLTNSGAVVNFPLFICKVSGGNVLGRMREIYLLGAKQGGMTYSISGSNKVHVVGLSNTTDDDAFSLKCP